MSELKKISNMRVLLHKIKYAKYYFGYFLHRKKMQPECIVIIVQDMEYQGSEKLAFYICKELIRRGISVSVLTEEVGPYLREYMELVPVRVVNRKNLHRLLKKVNLSGNRRAILNTVVTGNLVRETKNCGYKVVSLVHELEHVIRDNHYEDRCNLLAENSACVIFPARIVYNSFLQFVSNNKFNYKIKNQGLFLTEQISEDLLIPKEKIKLQLNIPIESKVVINVATANERKGFDLFLEAVDKMYVLDKNIYFIWVGPRTENYIKDNSQYSKLRLENLRCLGYINDKIYLSSIYYLSDLFFLSSREEPFGSVVLEAFSYGTPVIAFDGCGGFMEVVINHMTGILVPPFDVNKVCDETITLLEDLEEYKKISNNCLKVAKENNFEKYCEYIMSQFDEDKING